MASSRAIFAGFFKRQRNGALHGSEGFGLSAMSTGQSSPGERLNAMLAEAGLAPLDPCTGCGFEKYLSLFVRWNARVNLTSIRDEEGILSRHFVESIACARALPEGISTSVGFWFRRWLSGDPNCALQA